LKILNNEFEELHIKYYSDLSETYTKIENNINSIETEIEEIDNKKSTLTQTEYKDKLTTLNTNVESLKSQIDEK